MKNLQAELNKIIHGKRVTILFEGRDGAGKSGAIKRVTQFLPTSLYQVIHSNKPSESHMKNWLVNWRDKIFNIPHNIILLDRSWYSRPLVQRVNGWCTERQVKNFFKSVKKFEQDICDIENIILIKFWLSISEETQKKRLDIRKNSPLTFWKYSSNDELALSSFDKTTLAKENVIDSTWHIVDFNNKRDGQKRVLEIIVQELSK